MNGATNRELHDALIKKLSADGKVIELGFVAMCAVLLPDATPEQRDAARVHYMAGAQHLYASIMAMLDPGSEPTVADLRRMSLIDTELRAFSDEMKLRMARTGAAS